MPLVYSAIVPHSPVLMPTIGKDHLEKLADTTTALTTIAEHLRTLAPETLVMIAPQGDTAQTDDDTYYLHVPEIYCADFKEFGDLATTREYPSDHVLADHIKRELLEAGFEVKYLSHPRIEYDVSVPLYYLTKGLNTKVVVIYPSGGSAKTHLAFGKELQKVLQESPKHSALIASGELAHTHHEDSPAGYWHAAPTFDAQMVKILRERQYRKLANTKPEDIAQSKTCGLPSFLVLMGALERMHATSTLLSYEHPLGIGHVVIEYTL